MNATKEKYVKSIIPIHDSSDLAQYGFSTNARPVRKDNSGGWEWETACPQCGGVDRMIISNGRFWCRQQCGQRGWLSWIAYKKEIRIDPAKQRAAELKAKQEEKIKRDEQAARVVRLNQHKYWISHNKTLLKSPTHLDMLAADGITIENVRQYKLGLYRGFKAKHPATDQYIYVDGFTLPHFKGLKCVNIRVRILHPDFSKDKYRPYWWNLPYAFFPAFGPDDRYVVFVEGEKKAIVLRNHGVPAIGLWGIHGIKEEWIPWFLERFDRRYLMFDGDNVNIMLLTYREAERIQAKPVFLDDKPDDLLNAELITGECIKYLLKEV
jgi:hypothetical protein